MSYTHNKIRSLLNCMLQTFRESIKHHSQWSLTPCPCICLTEWRRTPQDEIWYWKQNVRPAPSPGQSAGRFTGVYCGSSSTVQSQPSHESPTSALLTYHTVRWAGLNGVPCLWLVRCALPPLSHPELLHLTGSNDGCLIFHWEKRWKARRKRETLSSVSYLVIHELLKCQLVNFQWWQRRYFWVFCSRVAGDGAFPLSWDRVRQEEGRV